MAAPAFRYHAFISHALADNRTPGRQWANWLRQALESYEVPPEFAGRRTPAGPVPARLFPIAQSEHELEPGAPLEAATREALEQSRVLILIGSPRAAHSRAVSEEVRYFKKLGRDRVLALIVAGEPGAADAAPPRPGGPPVEECFPETLRYEVKPDGAIDREWRLHPVAGDVRLDDRDEGCTTAVALQDVLEKEGKLRPAEIRPRVAEYADRLELARVTMIAGVLGVPLPELTRRAPARPAAGARPGRRPWLATALLVLLIAAAGWFVWRTYEQKRLSDEARRRADDLIGYLQHDLRERLEPVGQLALLADVNERVTRHLASVAAERNDPKAHAALAGALIDAVDIYRARADLPAALDAAEQALRVCQRVEAMPGAPSSNAVRRLAVHRRLAQINRQLARQSEALAQALEARRLGGELLREKAADEEIAREFAMASYEAGELLAETGRFEEAEQAILSGREALRRIAVQAADAARIQQEIAQGGLRLAEVKQRRGDLPAATLAYREALTILAPLATAAPANLPLQSMVATVHHRLGLLAVLERRFPDAVTEQRAAVALLERLTKSEPTNAIWQLDYTVCLRRLAEALLQSDAAAKTEALTIFQRALDHLAQQFPGENDPRARTLQVEIEQLRDAALR